jgi:hypothetical protein
MLIIEPLAFIASDEKLTAITIQPSVGHRQQSSFRMFQIEILVCEFIAINTDAPSSISFYNLNLLLFIVTFKVITALNHEVLYNPVKGAAFVTLRHIVYFVFACAQLTEILGCFRNHVCE